MMTRHYVIFRTSWTQSQVGAPIRCSSAEEAERKAGEFNRSNTDQTWNAVTAYPQAVRLNREGYAL